MGAVVAGAVGDRSEIGQRAATAEYERLAQGELKGYELVLLHGGMRPREKQAAMARFASGEADVLVATTVIEVGVDVANATVMLVENAERFGLSQLHQLRGRVGRGAAQSYCMLVTEKMNDTAKERIRTLVESGDGFKRHKPERQEQRRDQRPPGARMAVGMPMIMRVRMRMIVAMSHQFYFNASVRMLTHGGSTAPRPSGSGQARNSATS